MQSGIRFDLSQGVDTITDFAVGTDKFVLGRPTVFVDLQSPTGGVLLASEFGVVASDSQVGISSAKIVYSSGTGNLFYNADGVTAGFGKFGGQFATLTGAPANLSNTDFQII